jgi:hypothetical protein
MATTLRKAAFHRWLEAFPPDAEVGKRRHDCACPIARHLFAVENFNKEYALRRAITVGKFQWYISLTEEHQLQPWARAFIFALDDGRKRDQAVTAREALDLLNSL